MSSASRREINSGPWKQGRLMMTSNSLSSSSNMVAATPIYVWEEDTPTTGSVLIRAPSIAVASTAGIGSGAGTPPS
jgi:hypothetical protein